MKRILSLLLATCMVVGMMPMVALAEARSVRRRGRIGAGNSAGRNGTGNRTGRDGVDRVNRADGRADDRADG